MGLTSAIYLVLAAVGSPVLWWVSLRWFRHTTPPVPPAPTEREPSATWVRRWITDQQERQRTRDHAANVRWARLTVTFWLVTLALAWNVEATADAECRARIDSRRDTRTAIVAGVDEGAQFADLDDRTRDLISSRVESAVRSRLDPVDC